MLILNFNAAKLTLLQEFCHEEAISVNGRKLFLISSLRFRKTDTCWSGTRLAMDQSAETLMLSATAAGTVYFTHIHRQSSQLFKSTALPSI